MIFARSASESETVVGLIASALRRDIAFGQLPPDHKLKIESLRTRYGGSGHSVREALTLLADQGVLVESDAACEMYGDPFAVVPAHALEGVRGIRREAPQHRVELITILFAEEQVIYAEGGALLHCPVATMALDVLLEKDVQSYDMLAPREASFLAECMVMEDQILATAGWVDGQMAVHC